MALLSLSLNLEAQYRTRSWTSSGGTYNQRNSWSGLHRMKVINVFNNLHFEIYIWHEIRLMSWNEAICIWKPPDFMKSTGFHHEICQISWSTTECCIFHENWYRYTLLHAKYAVYKSLAWYLPDFMMKSTRFHDEICQIPWNPPNFTWSWNPPDLKSGGQMSQGPTVLFL